MANEKQINTRIQNKHDFEVNWLKATNFVPKDGEIIIYDKELDNDLNLLCSLPIGRTEPFKYVRFKIGDGITNVNKLPFGAGQEIVQETGTSETAVMSQKAVTDELSTINGALLKKIEIIDVDVLPTEGVNDTRLYRIKTFNGTRFWPYNDKLEPDGRFVLHFVDVLPTVGVSGRLYYQKSDGKHYEYSGADGKWFKILLPVVYSRAEVDAVGSHGAYLVENMDVKLYVPDTSNPYQIKWVALTNEADALITVDTLPESGGKDGYIYRIQKAYGAYWWIEHTGGLDDGEGSLPATLHYVDALPEVGLPFGGSVPLNIYKPKGDNGYYGYQNGEWDQIHRLFEIAQSYEEIKDSNVYIGFIPESTECKLYTYDNANPFKPKWVELTCGGGSIITVDSLPESDIDPESIYRLSNEFATVYVKGADGSISTNEFNGLPVKVYIVDELPIAGELFIDNADAPTRGVAYYCKADKELYLYAGEWLKFSDEIGAWQEVDSIDGVTTEGIAYVCLPKSKGLFHYDGEWHELVDTIVQTTGESETAVMSQKAATDALLSLKESLEQQIAGFGLTSGEGDGSIQQDGTNAISKHSVAFGSGTYAGGMGYKVIGIVLDNGIIITQETENPKKIEGTVVGYKLRTVEGLETEMNYSVRLGLAKYHCGTIASIDTTTQQILVNNAPQIKYLNTKQDDPDNDFIGNVLTITGRPELGDVNIGFNAISFGKDNASMERNTFTAGVDNSAIGSAGAAFGNGNIAGYEAFATGRNNKALGEQSSAFGGHNEVYGAFSQVHGDSNVVYSICASAEGYANTMNAKHGHVEGCRNIVDEAAIGAHVEGSDNTTVVGRYSHVEGSYNAVLAGSEYSHVEGDHNTIGSEDGTRVLAAHAEGSGTVASASCAHAEGYYTKSTGKYAHSEGEHAVAEGECSHAEGYYTKSIGLYAHSEGKQAVAEGDGSHAEGFYTKSIGECAHSEGYHAVAEGITSHAEGFYTKSIGLYAHSEGKQAVAEGDASHAGGSHTTASGLNSFTHGNYVNATEDNSVAFGQHNIPEGRLLSVGDGTEKVPSNAFEVFADGRVGAKTPAKELTDLVQLKQAIVLSRRAVESEEIDPTVMQFKENKNNPFELSVVAASKPKTPLTELYIPAIYNNKVVTSVGEAAFKNIKDEGYPYNGLTTLTVAYGVEKIESYAFEGCKALTYIDLPTTITEIGSMAFKQADIKTLVLPPHIKLIGGQAFRGKSIENAVRIPSTCTSIGYASKEAHCGKVFGSKVPAVIFEGVPEQIHENTFLDNDCDIYVPWSEGEVAGAPWGTTGIVHYNYRYATMDTVDELETRVATLENAEVEVDLTDYAKKSEVPTSMSALTNDAGYTTAIDVQTMIDEAIGSAIGGSY